MSAGDPAMTALLAAARLQFATSLPGKIAALRASVATGAWEEVRRGAHKLRGSAATYGFLELGQCAAAIEDALLPGGSDPDDHVREHVAVLLTDADALAARAADDTP